ncbi:ABC transporter permease [Candidatus Poribacteria bacterium]|nr:ABC transporter permease [Candidatus Poribacteria bacterium]
MLLTLIQKEMMHHILSVRFVALLVMCLLLVPLTLHINYRNYLQSQVNYQTAIELSVAEIDDALHPLRDPPAPDTEFSKLFLEPTPLSVFAKGVEESLPGYLGMTRNGVKHGSTSLGEGSLSSALGNLDFLFVVSTVFSLLALLFTFDAVAGEREAGTLRVTLANALPRDMFLWSKLIGGYIVFVVPFLVSFLLGLFLLVSQGFPLGESDIFPRVLSLTLVSLLYIGVFFAIGTLISTYLDNSKTALIVAFSVWVLAVLIAPRVGFLTAKFIAPTRAIQSVYMEKAAINSNLNEEKDQVIITKMRALGDINLGKDQEKIKALRTPIDAEYRQKFQEQVGEIERAYQREKKRQESVGETLSRITPTASLIYVAMNLTETGKIKRDIYFETGTRYYNQLEAEYFHEISDDQFARFLRSDQPKPQKISPPPDMTETRLSETVRHSMVDLLLLCFLAVVLTTVAFLKFFSVDI